MRFAFTEDQLGFRAAVRELLERACPPARVRAAWEAQGAPLAVWPQLAEMGVLGITAAEGWGGLGLDALDLVLVLEESGRAALPEPLLETTALAIPLLEETADPAVKDRWIGAAVAGKAVLTVGLSPATAPGGGSYVVEADRAALLLLERDGELHAVPRDRVEVTAQPSVDGARRIYSVRWQPEAATRLLSGNRTAAAAAIAATIDRAAVGSAAQLLGAAAAMIERTVEYAKIRTQFGKPIGSFQAVKHQLADAHVALELARPVVYRAAASLAGRAPDASLHASMAKAQASEAALRAARAALQCHGAIGYSFEYDLHMWMKRAWALAAAWGDAAWHRARVATAVLDLDQGEIGWETRSS